MPRVPAVVSVAALALGALVAAGVLAVGFFLEGRARDAAHALERQTANVGAAARLARSVDVMMASLLALKVGVSDELVRQHAGSRREFDEALERLKRLAADDGDAGLARRAATIEELTDDWQRQVTVPLLQRRQQEPASRSGTQATGSPAVEEAGRIDRIRETARDLESYTRDVQAARRFAVERIAVRERLLGRGLAVAVAVGLAAACALRWRAAWPAAPS